MPTSVDILPVAERLKIARELLNRLVPARHSRDFASIHWFGTPYFFSPSQAIVIRELWEAWEQDTPALRQETLIEAAGSQCDKLSDLFKGHPAWGTLIVSGPGKGTFRLIEPSPPQNP